MRFHPHTKEDRQAMLDAIGVESVDALYAMVPESANLNKALDLPPTKSEMEVEHHLSLLANQNAAACDRPFFLGAGCYHHHIPSTVDMIIQRSEFLTAYTPYQPEISQGTLNVIFEFQSLIATLTGQEIANASMYDGATATLEAALMAQRLTRRKKVIVHGALHPHYRQLMEDYWAGDDVLASEEAADKETACVIIQTPDFHGTPQDIADLRKECDAAGAKLVVVINEIVSLGMLPAPEAADIVVGEAQSLGVPMGFGGPHLGFFATKKAMVRQMPGRLAGATEDADGKRGFVLTLNTREQHIRREKATSNICTNQGLMAVAFTAHAALLGEEGFKRLALKNHERACALADALEGAGFKVENDTFFNEFVVDVKVEAKAKVEALAEQGIIAGYALDGGRLLVAATEMTRDEDITRFVEALK